MNANDDAVDLCVIAAHPDDAELAIGGTILKAHERGYRTAIVDLTRAELSTRGDLQTRAAETARATEILAIDRRENLGLPDGGVRDDDEARRLLIGAIRRLRPRIMLAPWKDDLHADHAGAGRLAESCWYLSGVSKFAPGEPPFRPQLLGFYMAHTPFIPNAVIDVSSVWERKMDAVRAYASQFHRPGDSGPPTKISRPDFFRSLEGRARQYGLMVGFTHGEPIRWEYPAPLADPVSFLAAAAGEERS